MKDPSMSQMDDYCKDKGFIQWFQTSAKENINIDEAARALVTQVRNVMHNRIYNIHKKMLQGVIMLNLLCETH